MTLREVYREFVVAYRRDVARHNASVWQAWYGALFTRQGGPPDRCLIGLVKARRNHQTADEMRPLLHLMAAQWGVPVMRGGKPVVM